MSVGFWGNGDHMIIGSHTDNVTEIDYFFSPFSGFCTQIDGGRLFKDVKAYYTAVKGGYLLDCTDSEQC